MGEIVGCEISVYLAFYGDFDPEQMRGLFSADAPHLVTYRKGDMRRSTQTRVTVDSLEMGTGERQTYALEALLDEVHTFSADWPRVGEEARRRQLDVFLHVVAYFSGSAPAVIFAPRHLRWLADLGATVDVDLYSGSHAR